MGEGHESLSRCPRSHHAINREVVGPRAPHQSAFWCREADEFIEFLPFWVLEFNCAQKG